MNCLIVIAHPLSNSLCAAMADRAAKALRAAKHKVIVEDLYASDFDSAMYPAERLSYYDLPYDTQLVENQVAHLLAADAIVLAFPTWWFGFPAVLKGWFDRVWAPGVAFDHAANFGPIKPRLTNLKHVLAITSLGAPGWVDRLIMRQPLKRILKTAIIGTCTEGCKFKMATVYKSETLTPQKIDRFSTKVEGLLAQW